MHKIKSKPLYIALYVIVIVSMLSCVIFMSENKIKATNKIRAEIIINAIYEYQAKNHSFPSQLSDLVPEFLDSVPITVGNDDFFYRMDSVDGFYIFFEVSPHYGCSYADQDKQWECSGGGD